ncbi:transposase, partial [Bacillus thuringiensis]
QIQEREICIITGEEKRYYLSKIGKWFRKIEGEREIQIDNKEMQQALKEK